jgi:hypothetical protein
MVKNQSPRLTGAAFFGPRLVALSMSPRYRRHHPRGTDRFMIRIVSIALAFLALTLVLLPFQLIGLLFDLRLQRTIPHLYHICFTRCRRAPSMSP